MIIMTIIIIIMFIRNRTPKYREPGVLGGSSQSAPNLAQIPQVDDDNHNVWDLIACVLHPNYRYLYHMNDTFRCSPSGGTVACTPTLPDTMLVNLILYQFIFVLSHCCHSEWHHLDVHQQRLCFDARPCFTVGRPGLTPVALHAPPRSSMDPPL